MEHLYITDDDSNKNSPRRDYIPNFEAKTSRRPKLQDLRSRPLAATSRGRFDDLEVEDDDNDDTPAFDFKGFDFFAQIKKKMFLIQIKRSEMNNFLRIVIFPQ